MSTQGNSEIYLDCLAKVEQEVCRFFHEEDVKVVLFGSAAKGNNGRYSDIDIGVLCGDAFDRRRLSLLRMHFDELNIPYIVELVDLDTVSSTFRASVLSEGVVWIN